MKALRFIQVITNSGEPGYTYEIDGRNLKTDRLSRIKLVNDSEGTKVLESPQTQSRLCLYFSTQPNIPTTFSID